MENEPLKAPTEIRTERLLLRKPEAEDAEEIFRRYAGDVSIGPYLVWPIHRSVDDTRGFLAFSESEWQRWPGGPYLICRKRDRTIVGSTGLGFETPERASTGYVVAKEFWGRGIATEAVLAVKRLAHDIGLRQLFACCHPDHRPSRRVLEKAGFVLEGTVRRRYEFPNLAPGTLQDVVRYVW